MKWMRNKDIANALGISEAAVSLALNNKSGVSDETRRKVWAFLEETDYKSGVIDFQEQNKAKTLLLCIHKSHGEIIIDKPFFSDLIESVQTEAARHHYSLLISHYTKQMDLEEYVNSLNSQNAIGAIIMATELLTESLQAYKRLKIPFVLLDSSFDFEPIDSVTIDNSDAIMKAFAYAYRMGHRNIGYLRSSVYINNFEHRFDGYNTALRRFGLKTNDVVVVSLPCSIDSAYEQMNCYLKMLPTHSSLPTCFLADLDYIALGAMRALREAGYRIPEDISIIGFDDVAACESSTPRLTTMHVNRNTIGLFAVDALLRRLHCPHSYHVHIQLSSELVERDSVIKR